MGVAAMQRAVVKCGGSLLRSQAGPAALSRVLDELVDCYGGLLVVVGGGEAADLVRRWHRRWNLADDTAHWLAVRAMQLNTHLLRALVCPQAPVIASMEGLDQEAPVVLADPEPLLREAERLTSWMLPASWDVTADAIAALLAAACRAETLVLVKQGQPMADLCHAERAGVVDRYVRRVLRRFPKVRAEFRWMRVASP